jgi:hypothetical protein
VRGVPDISAPPWVRLDSPEETIDTVTGVDTLAWPLWMVYCTGSNYNLTLPIASTVPIIGPNAPSFTIQVSSSSVGIVLYAQGPDFINNDQPTLTLVPGTTYLLTSDNVANWTVT